MRGKGFTMNVLVTGGAGFIGSHVAEALINSGHHVIIVDNLSTGNKANIPEGATFYEVDIVDQASLDKIFADEKIEAVSHQAALANVRESMSDPLTYAKVNLIGTLTLLELARKYSCRKFVFASTGGAVYGEGASPDNSKLPFTEQSWPQPKDNYGTNKLSAEYHLDLYHQNYNLPYVALRYPNVYGPRQNNKGEAGVIAIFAAAMLEGEPTRITGNGEQTRDFTYVGDIARANLVALQSEHVGIFNVGTGVPSSITMVHDYLTEITSYDQDVTRIPRPTGEVLSTYLDSSKAKNVLGWEAEVPLETGLRQTVEWFRTKR
jgi:UDP-glucose 4-epimerase